MTTISDSLGAVSGAIDPKTKLIIRTARAIARPETLARGGVISSDLNLSDAAITPLVATLPETKELYLRFPNVSAKPLLAVARLSPAGAGNDGFIPFALVVLSAQPFTEEKGLADLTLIYRESRFLFSTDFPSDQAADLNAYREVLSPKTPATQWLEVARASDTYLFGITPIDSSLSVIFRVKASVVAGRTADDKAKTLFASLLAFAAAVSLALYFARRIFPRVAAVTNALPRFTSGADSSALTIGPNDEVGALVASANAVPTAVAALRERHREEFRAESEKVISAAVQQTLIPPDRFRSPLMSIRSHYQPASEFSGDWWGFFGVGHRLCILIGDCTGRGFQSALMTAAVRSCFSVMHKLAVENEEFSYSPGAMLSYANRSIFDTSSGRAAMTLFASVIDFSTGRMSYASAGHNPPWLFHKGKDGKFSSVSLISRGQRLGEARNVPDFHEESVQIHKGDILFLYTDGLIDVLGPTQERYGKMRTRRIVEANLSQGPDAVVTQLKNDLQAFAQNTRPDDDVTFACVEFLPDGKTS